MTNTGTVVSISLDDIDDNDIAEIVIPRTISKDIQSRRSFRERRNTFREDFEVVTKVEAAPTMSDIVNGRAA